MGTPQGKVHLLFAGNFLVLTSHIHSKEGLSATAQYKCQLFLQGGKICLMNEHLQSVHAQESLE